MLVSYDEASRVTKKVKKMGTNTWNSTLTFKYLCWALKDYTHASRHLSTLFHNWNLRHHSLSHFVYLFWPNHILVSQFFIQLKIYNYLTLVHRSFSCLCSPHQTNDTKRSILNLLLFFWLLNLLYIFFSKNELTTLKIITKDLFLKTYVNAKRKCLLWCVCFALCKC